MARRGFTLIELLVAIAIVAVLTGLVLGAVQSARAAAAKASCANNLRQLVLGLHGYHSVSGRLPPGVRVRKDPYPCMTWSARLLPHLEQQAAWNEAVEDYKKQPLFSRPVPHRNLARTLPVFLCPAGDRHIGTTDEDTTAAFTYYLGIAASAGELRDGLLYYESEHRLADVTDGVSNTVLVGERPPSADNHFGWWYAGIGMSHFDGSADSVMAAREFNRTFRAPTCPRGPYPFQPGKSDDLCSMFHFWSLHPGGAHFAFADGSVRFLSYSANDILPALATRAGGESVDVP